MFHSIEALSSLFGASGDGFRSRVRPCSHSEAGYIFRARPSCWYRLFSFFDVCSYISFALADWVGFVMDTLQFLSLWIVRLLALVVDLLLPTCQLNAVMGSWSSSAVDSYCHAGCEGCTIVTRTQLLTWSSYLFCLTDGEASGDVATRQSNPATTGMVLPAVGIACLGAILFGYHLGYFLIRGHFYCCLSKL